MKRYRKNKYGEFQKPFYLMYKYQLLLILLICVSLVLFKHFFWAAILFTTLHIIWGSILYSKVRGNPPCYWLDTLLIEKRVKRNLISTMVVNRNIETPFIDVPTVKVSVKKSDNPSVKIERLAGMNDIETIIPNVNLAFTNKLQHYAVTSYFENDNGLDYTFFLEDVASDKTFRPRYEEELQVEPYSLILQNDTRVPLSICPHIGIFGRSGSGKTTVLYSLILQFFNMGADCVFIDGKMEFSSFSAFYPKQKIVSEKDKILALLDEVCDEITIRQGIMAEEVNKRRKIGLTGYDINLMPLIVIADEIGSIVSSMSTKERNQFFSYLSQISQKGRSVSTFLIIGNQFANVETLPNNIRSQLSTRILLGTANNELQRMVFNESKIIKTGDVERFKGYYVSENHNSQPLRFFVPDLHTHKLADDIDIFQRAYIFGQKNYSHTYYGGYAYDDDNK
ncbi:FtsK/SpoIIIE family protein [Streptococcus constellatus]|nr:FtsK/SpoIIIE family protein [Streptococcus constellatus]